MELENRVHQPLLQNVLKIFWNSKKIIFAITSVCVLLSIIHLAKVKPIYEAKAYIIPPTPYDLEQLNYGRPKPEYWINYIRPVQVYTLFNKVLFSEELKQQFFRTFYLPSLTDRQRKMKPDRLYKYYLRQVFAGAAPFHGLYSRDEVVIKSSSPEKAKDLVLKYINLAKKNARLELSKQFIYENKSAANLLKLKIDVARQIADQGKKDRLNQLSEALAIAKAAEMKEHAKLNLTGWDTLPLMYFRGSIALEAEIKNLKSRENNDAYIPILRKLQSDYFFFSNAHISPNKIKLFRMDGEIKSPDIPLPSHRMLILMFSLMAGFMLSGIIVLIRSLFKGTAFS